MNLKTTDDRRPTCLRVSPPEAETWAERLGVSLEAVALYNATEVVDLQVDSFTPARLFRYNLFQDHPTGVPLTGRFGHADFPRALRGGVGGAVWSMTTNPLRSAGGQWRTLLGNLELVRQVVDGTGGAMSLVTDYPGYVAARRAGAHGCMLAIQGASPLLHSPDGLAGLPQDLVVRVALVHLFSGRAGSSASSLGFVGRRATLPTGAEGLIEALDERRIQLDLSHLSPAHFRRALEVHDRELPVVVSHVGARALTPRGTNLTDAQLRSVAETDGVVGVTLNRSAVRRAGQVDGVETVIDHLAHMVDLLGDRHVGLGSDLDGGGRPISGLAGWDLWPRLVQGLLQRGWTADRVQRVLGGNALRVLLAHRPGQGDAAIGEDALGEAISADRIPWAAQEVPALEEVSPPTPDANTQRLSDREDRSGRSQSRPRPEAPSETPEVSAAPPSTPPPAPEPVSPVQEVSPDKEVSVSDRRGFFRLGRDQVKDTALQTARGLVSAAGEFKDELVQEREDDDFHRDRVRTTGEPAGRAFVRPPGALEEAAFLETCEKCQACAKACPEASIVPAGPQHGRRVEMSPILILDQQPCFLCEDVPCASACPSGALQPIAASAIRIAVAEVIGERCLNALGESCDVCVQRCPKPEVAIRMGPDRLPIVNTGECTGCGQCIFACPAHPKALVARPL